MGINLNLDYWDRQWTMVMTDLVETLIFIFYKKQEGPGSLTWQWFYLAIFTALYGSHFPIQNLCILVLNFPILWNIFPNVKEKVFSPNPNKINAWDWLFMKVYESIASLKVQL